MVKSSALCPGRAPAKPAAPLDDVDRVRRVIEERCQTIGRKVALVVNYDNFLIDAAVADTYAAMVRYMETRYYTTASRYTTSAFLRLKLGEALAKRRVAPHIFETGEEAHAFVEIESKTTRKKSKPLEPADSTPIRQVGERDRWAGPGIHRHPSRLKASRRSRS